MRGLYSHSREYRKIFLRSHFLHISRILEGNYFGAYTCRACIRTRANTGKYSWGIIYVEGPRIEKIQSREAIWYVYAPLIPPERKPERGYVRMFPRNENRNQGTFACSPGTKTGRGYIRQNHPLTKPPFCLPVILVLFKK